MKTGQVAKKQQELMILDLVEALTFTKSIEEVILFLQDLLTQQEMKTLSKRLQIAKLLLKGFTYEEIEENLHTSHTTVAKIASWLAERGDGFRKIIEKLPKEKSVDALESTLDWDRLKRRYSIYFWPELLLQEIVKGASEKQRDRIKNVLSTLEEKSDLHRKIEKLLHQDSNTT